VLVNAGVIILLMTQLPLTTWVRFFGWLLAGILIYVFHGYRHSRLRRAAVELRRTERRAQQQP
jgi:APA family basic amino acid/polyamine antiporter